MTLMFVSKSDNRAVNIALASAHFAKLALALDKRFDVFAEERIGDAWLYTQTLKDH